MPSMRSWSEARLLFRSHKRHELHSILIPSCTLAIYAAWIHQQLHATSLLDLSLLVDSRVWTPDSLNPMPSSDSTKSANSIEQLEQFM